MAKKIVAMVKLQCNAGNAPSAPPFGPALGTPGINLMDFRQQFNGTPNVPANELTPEIIKSNPNVNVGADTMARLQIFEDIGAALKLYDRAWNTIRTAQ